MANGWAERERKSSDANWRAGWVDGFKKGFASTRGGKKDLRENPKFEKLSWKNIAAGTKVYEGNEKHIATIVSSNQAEGLINVRYVKSGSVEPKSLEAVSQLWFVKRKEKAID